MLIENLEGRRLLSVYFINPSGADSNDGLSPETAWASISKVNAISFAAGDEILFSAGNAFGGTLLLGADDAGSPLAPVKVGSYGEGRATINAGNGAGVLVVNTQGVEVSNLKVAGAGQSPASFSGIEFRNTLPGNVKLEHVRVNNVEVSGFGDYGIEVIGTADKSGFKDVRIEYVNVHDNTNGGIASTGLWNNTSTLYAHEDFYVGHAKVWRNTGWAGSPNHSGSGIVLADIKGVTIERSEAYENGANNTHVGGPVGIWVWDVDQALIQYNESHHNLTNSTADGGGFDFDGGVTNSVMQYNYSHHNAGAGYGIYQFAGARAFFNNHVRYNISVDDGRKNSYGAFDFWNGNGSNGIRDTYVYNNTVYVSPSTTTQTTYDRKGNPVVTTVKVGDPRAVRFISGTVGVSIVNNNFHATGDVLLAQIDAKQTNLTLNGNNWFSEGGFKLKAFAKTYTTFSTYQSATGYDRQSISVNSQMLNPLSKPTVGIDAIDTLSNALTGYRLSSSSTLRNKGVAGNWSYIQITPASRDFYGNALPGDGLTDIGAHEYV